MDKSKQTDAGAPYGVANFFQSFFEKALGPKEQEPKRKHRPKRIKTHKYIEPSVKYNPSAAMMSTTSLDGGEPDELIAQKGTILKIATDHFALNKSLKQSEEVNKSKLRFDQIQSLINLDCENRTKYRIILEGGKLLCNFLDIIKERDFLLAHSKLLVETCVKNTYADPTALENVVNSITPALVINGEDSVHNIPNPIIPILTDALFQELKKVKHAAEIQKQNEFNKKE
jgi:hypothetical protein